MNAFGIAFLITFMATLFYGMYLFIHFCILCVGSLRKSEAVACAAPGARWFVRAYYNAKHWA